MQYLDRSGEEFLDRKHNISVLELSGDFTGKIQVFVHAEEEEKLTATVGAPTINTLDKSDDCVVLDEQSAAGDSKSGKVVGGK